MKLYTSCLEVRAEAAAPIKTISGDKDKGSKGVRKSKASRITDFCKGSKSCPGRRHVGDGIEWLKQCGQKMVLLVNQQIVAGEQVIS